MGLKDYPKARDILKQGWRTLKFTPFDPVSKRITSEVERDGKHYTCAKGAPNAYERFSYYNALIDNKSLRHLAFFDYVILLKMSCRLIWKKVTVLLSVDFVHWVSP